MRNVELLGLRSGASSARDQRAVPNIRRPSLAFASERGPGFFGRHHFERLEDGTYVCGGYGASPTFIRCLAHHDEGIEVVDGTGERFTYRLRPHPAPGTRAVLARICLRSHGRWSPSPESPPGRPTGRVGGSN
jgi:hypothetical protein